MGNDLSKHLTAEELNRLASNRAVKADEKYATAHCAKCADCAELLKNYRHAEEQLQALKNDSGSDRHELCTSPEDSARFSISAMTESRIAEIIDHAVNCADCAAQLRAAISDGNEQSPTQSASLNPIQSVNFAPLQFLAGRTRRRTIKRARFWAAAIAACILLSAGLFWLQARSKTPQALLAQAYSDARPFQMRYPGASYGSIRNTRSAEGALSRPKALLNAEIKIRELPEDSQSLYLKGSLELLNRRYDAAIRFLEQARASSTPPPETALLLAIALFQRGELFHTADRLQDFVEALNLFQEFLAKHPSDPAGLFDLALCYEAVEDLPAAVDTWKRLIALDSKSPWSVEAKDHLSRLEKRLGDRGQLENPVHADPNKFILLAKSGATILPEFHLQAAIISWLPHLDDTQARLAVQILADIFRKQCSDSYLSDLLRARPSAEGFASLANAVEANRRAMHAQAEIESRSAEKSFTAVGNIPGVLRAQSERLYALHRLFRSDCLAAGTLLDSALRNKPYSWLRTQVRLELANCYAFQNDYGRAAKSASNALQGARELHLPDLELRAAGLLSAFHFYAGDTSGAIRECLPTLAAYWQSAFPPNRAQQCFHNLSLASENLGWHYAAAAFAREKLSIMLGTEEVLLEARGRVSLARLSIESGDYPAARTQLEEARTLFDASPGLPEKRPLVEDAQIDQAAVELALHGATDKLIADLLIIAGPNAADVGGPTEETRLRALELLARARIQRKQVEPARANLREAIRIHRVRLLGLASDWERTQSAEQYAGIYRQLADLQFSDDHNPAAALLTWSANRSSRLETLRSALQLQQNRRVLAMSCLPGGPVAWATTNGSIVGWRIDGSNAELQRESEYLALAAAVPESSVVAIEVHAKDLKQRIFARAPSTVSRSFDAVDLDWCAASLPLPLIFPEGVVQAGLRSLAEPHREWHMADAKGLIISSPQLRGEMAHIYSSLPNVQEESAAVAAELGTANTLSGQEATLVSLARYRQGVTIVHFAGHGVGFGGSGSLLMAPNDSRTEDFQLLSAPVIGKQDWHECELVVLSACSTAGGGGATAASSNLMRAFLAAGAHRVVASLWNVDSAATGAIMELFYRYLKDGASPPQALAQASAAVRARSQWRHPYYWAAFQLYGEG